MAPEFDRLPRRGGRSRRYVLSADLPPPADRIETISSPSEDGKEKVGSGAHWDSRAHQGKGVPGRVAGAEFSRSKERLSL